MSSLTLYDISDTLVALLDSYDMCETDEQRMQCEAEIRQTVELQIRKVDDFCRFLAHLESQADLAAKEIERLKARKSRFENLEERLEQYAIWTLQSLGLRKLDGNTSKLTLRTNQPGVEIDDGELVPPQFKTIKQEIVIDKRGIKKAIDAGANVPGAHLREPSISLLRR
jgi:hypothetical protein